jgi:AraC-like DNA-binding protein
MKALLKKSPVAEKASFLINSYRLPDFDQEWHYHNEYEIICFIDGSGMARVGNNECIFQAGDIFMLSNNLAHQFQPIANTEIEAIIIHFRSDCWGMDFFQAPECQSIRKLLNVACAGLKLTGDIRLQLQPLIKSIEIASEAHRIILLLQCLQSFTSTNDYITISTLDPNALKKNNNDCLEKIFKYTNDTFNSEVTLHKIAAVACMSIPTFCNYFKRQTNKTYITYLNEVRVHYACLQLLHTSKPVTDIGYESGFNTVAHFHRQFIRLKNITPLQYRKTNLEQ